mmetsp:Transcript_3687/g.3621  ORF Transcript_3687/g.3621 Transcript_3687/m.3621 type:complete len:191 (+) Transcript_3687:1207-1779(+)
MPLDILRIVLIQFCFEINKLIQVNSNQKEKFFLYFQMIFYGLKLLGMSGELYRGQVVSSISLSLHYGKQLLESLQIWSDLNYIQQNMYNNLETLSFKNMSEGIEELDLNVDYSFPEAIKEERLKLNEPFWVSIYDDDSLQAQFNQNFNNFKQVFKGAIEIHGFIQKNRKVMSQSQVHEIEKRYGINIRGH